jgi:Protein of unknown function (DUF2934)
MENPTEKQIVRRAYELWEQAGKPEGRDHQFYHLAEQELRDADKSSPLRTRTICEYGCPVCFGIGGLRSHSDRAWHEELGCMCGAGMPCKCNSGEELDVSQG